jgi:hypothetical protein
MGTGSEATAKDIRLTMWVYTHVELSDHQAAIESLPPPPRLDGLSPPHRSELRATGTDDGVPGSDTQDKKKVPTVVPRGAQNGAVRLASETLRIARDCTQDAEEGGSSIAASPREIGTFCTESDDAASNCIESARCLKEAHPEGFEPPTLGSEDRCSIQLSYGCKCRFFQGNRRIAG